MPSLWIFNHYAGFPETVPATRTFELAKHLASQGWDVTVIACSFNHYTFIDDYPEYKNKVTEVSRAGVRWIFIKGHPYDDNGLARFANMIEYSFRAWRWSRSQPAVDFVIGTTIHPFAAEAARRIAKRTGAAYIYEVTDLWPESLVDLGHVSRKSGRYRLMRQLERRSLSEAAGVIGIPPGVADYALATYGLTLKNYCNIPNGTVRPSVDSLVGPSPLPGTVAYAGGFAPAHAMPTVLRVAGRLQASHPGRFVFHLYGDGPERSSLEETAARSCLTNVVFHGLVPKASLHEHLMAAQICLCTGESLPVHRYGISFNKIFDYFKAARPIVFAVDSGNDPVAEAGAGFSVAAGDDAGIAAAIVTLAELDADTQRAMGLNGREFLLREHSFDQLGTRLEQFLMKVGVTQ